MALPASHDFTGTAGTLPASFTILEVGGSQVPELDGSGNLQASGDGDALCRWNADAFGNDHYSRVNVSSYANGASIQLVVRSAGDVLGTPDAYMCYWDNATGDLGIGRWNDGSFTNIATTNLGAGNSPWATNDDAILEVDSSATVNLRIRRIRSGTLSTLFSTTDSDANRLLSGAPGPGMDNNGTATDVKFGSWTGDNGTVSLGGGGSAPMFRGA